MFGRRQKVIDSAKQYVEPGEEIRYVVSGQTGAPQGTLLGALMIAIGQAKQRRVVATEKAVYVLRGDFWGTARSKGLISRHELGETRIESAKYLLRIDGETVFMHRNALGDWAEIATL